MNVKETFNKMINTVIELGSIEKEVTQLQKQVKTLNGESEFFPVPPCLSKYNYLSKLYEVKEEFLSLMSIKITNQLESIGINTFGISMDNYVRSLYLSAVATVGIENNDLIKKVMIATAIAHQKDGIKPLRREVLTQQYIKNQQDAMKNIKK